MTRKRIVSIATALLGVVALAGTGTPASAAGSCRTGGTTTHTAQGVRLYTVKNKAHGKTRVRLLACAPGAKTPTALAYGPPSLVAFGAFHTSGPHVGFEVTGVQSRRGQAGAGTNYNIGWVDSRTGLVRMNFLFVTPIRPPHRYAIDAATGALATLIGTSGKPQTLFEASYDPATKDFAGADKHQLDGDWNVVYHAPYAGAIRPASMRFTGGNLVYTNDNGTVVIDPATGKTPAG